MEVYRVLSSLIDNSTSENLNAPDVNAMQEVAELVRSRADLPKETIRLITIKLSKRDKKVTLLTLELLEYLTYTCEITLYNQIATKDFLLKVGQILKSHDQGEQAVARASCLIKCWRDLFNRDLHQLFFAFYENASKKVEIPVNYSSPYQHLRGSVSKASSNNNINSNGNNNAFNRPSNTANNKPTGPPLSGAKAKLKSDMELIKQNITLVNDIIDGQDPRGNVEQNDSLNDLMPTIKKQEQQMMPLVEKLANENDEQLLELCLQLNDDLQTTIERYASLKRHMKPKPFRGKAVEDDVLQQISKLEQQPDQNNNNGFSASIFSETAQSFNQGVTKAAFKIPPPGNNNINNNFGSNSNAASGFAQQSQPPAQVQKPVISKPAATNLLDLLDDDEPATTVISPPTTFVQQPTNVVQQQPGGYQPAGQPNFSNGGMATTTNMNPPATSLVYPPQQQPQQMPQQAANNYSAFNTLGQQQMNPMGYAMNNQGYNGMNPNMMGGGYNTMSGGQNMMGQPNQQFGNMYNTNAAGYQAQQQPMGYGMQNMGGYGSSVSTAPSAASSSSFMPSTNMNGGGYGGGLSMTSNSMPPVNSNGGYGQAIAKKDAFDDLDDMFGIGGPSSKPAANNNNFNNNAGSQPSYAASKPPANQVDFDLF